MSISSDEINYLIYRYLLENGFSHSAFTFSYESLVTKSSVSQIDVPPGALITFLQKGLEYVGIEEHINEDGTIRDYDGNFSLLAPFICDAVAVKEERKQRKSSNSNSLASATSTVQIDSGVNSKATSVGNNAPSLESAGGKPVPAIMTPPAADIRLQRDGRGVKFLQLGGHQGEVFMCSWNPAKNPADHTHQHQLATGSADGICRLWGLDDVSNEVWNTSEQSGATETNISLRTGLLPHASYMGEKTKDVTSISWSADGTYLATGCYDGLGRVWNCATGELKFLLKEHKESIFAVKWNKVSNRIITVSHDKRAIVWNANDGSIVRIFEKIHTSPILDVDWRDEDIFATCSTDAIISVCSLSCTEVDVVHVFEGHKDEINAICWSPNGQYLASCSDDNTAKVWVLMGEGEKYNGEGIKESGVVTVKPETTECEVDENLSPVVARTHKRCGYLLYDLCGHAKEIYTTRWTPTGPGSNNPDKELCLCTASFDGNVKVWRMSDGSVMYNLCNSVKTNLHSTLPSLKKEDDELTGNEPQPVYSVASSPNGKFLAIGSQGGYVSIWDMSNGTLLVEEKGFGDTFDVSWSLDGKLLSACFASGIVNVMNVDNLLASSTTGDAAGSIRIGSELESNVPMEPVEDSIVAKMQEGVSADVVVPAEKLDDMNVEENAEKGDTGALEPLVEPLVTNESDAEPEPEPAMEEA